MSAEEIVGLRVHRSAVRSGSHFRATCLRPNTLSAGSDTVLEIRPVRRSATRANGRKAAAHDCKVVPLLHDTGVGVTRTGYLALSSQLVPAFKNTSQLFAASHGRRRYSCRVEYARIETACLAHVDDSYFYGVFAIGAPDLAG